MYQSSVPLCVLLIILNLQPSSMNPISSSLKDSDIDILKVLLHRLEESISEQTLVDPEVPSEMENLNSLEEMVKEKQPNVDLDEEEIRQFLSAKSLKSLRNDPSRRSSGCFGRRMDRIGSMSSLGCNTIGRYNPK